MFKTLGSNILVRRLFVMAVAIAAAIAATLVLAVVNAMTVRVSVTRSQILWLLISLEVVAAAFWWGVGDGSRYTAPSEAAMTSATDRSGKA